MMEQELEREHFEKICNQIELPHKPRVGSLVKWIFLAIGILGSLFGLTRTGMAETEVQSVWNMVFGLPFLMLAVLDLVNIIFSYVIEKREYDLSKTNEKEYRIQKALEFLKRNDEDKKYYELIHEFYTEYPEVWQRMERKKHWSLFIMNWH